MLIAALGVAMTAKDVVAGPRIIELQMQSDKLATLVAQRLAQETPQCVRSRTELTDSCGPIDCQKTPL